jgi:hypothetical protein
LGSTGSHPCSRFQVPVMVESPSGELPMTLLTDFDSWGGRSATIPTAPTATVLKLRDAAQEIFGVGFLRASTWHRWVATETGRSWRKHKNQQQIEWTRIGIGMYLSTKKRRGT